MSVPDSTNKPREIVTIMTMLAVSAATVVGAVIAIDQFLAAALDQWVLGYDNNPAASLEAAARANRALALLDADIVVGFALLAVVAAIRRESYFCRGYAPPYPWFACSSDDLSVSTVSMTCTKSESVRGWRRNRIRWVRR